MCIMETSVDKFTTDILSLPEKYRAKWAGLLIRSFNDSSVQIQSSKSEAESAWDEEILRRVRQIEEGMATGYPAENVFSEIKAGYNGRKRFHMACGNCSFKA